MTYYFSPSGEPYADGLSELNPFPATRLANFLPQPGDTVRLQGGVTFPGWIDWYDGKVGDPTRPIMLSSYGAGRPVIQSPVNREALLYAGPGGIHVEGIDFRGNCTRPGVSGLRLGGVGDACANIRLTDVDVSGYSLGGIEMAGTKEHPVCDVLIHKSRLHHNANGTHLGSVKGLTLTEVKAWENDLIGGDPNRDVGGYGIAIYDSRNVHLEKVQANRNGWKTTVGGHGGIILQNCDDGYVGYSFAVGNGDPTENGDGQGIIFYGSQNCIGEHNHVAYNLNGGLSLHQDEGCGPVERCILRHNWLLLNTVGLHLNGDVLDCEVYENVVHTDSLDGAYRKCVDISDSTGVRSTKRVLLWSNEHRALLGALLLEAVRLTGVSSLSADIWDSDAPIFRVGDVDYTTAEEVLATEVA